MSKPASILPVVGRINSKYNVILASGSPRRKDLATLMGFTSFNIKISNFAEDLEHSSFATPQLYCLETARKKIEQVAMDIGATAQPTLLFGADTIVEVDGKILEKPADNMSSKRMLLSLSNRSHFVHTAVVAFTNSPKLNDPHSLLDAPVPLQPLVSFVETTKVTFGGLTESDIDAYVALGEGLDKAGSYGIQGVGSLFVRSIEGCYFNVMGLPVHRLSRELASAFEY
jgi:septum formation protein